MNMLTRFIVDYNLAKSWRVVKKLRPEVVMFLGDLMDDGRLDITDAEYHFSFLAVLLLMVYLDTKNMLIGLTKHSD